MVVVGGNLEEALGVARVDGELGREIARGGAVPDRQRRHLDELGARIAGHVGPQQPVLGGVDRYLPYLFPQSQKFQGDMDTMANEYFTKIVNGALPTDSTIYLPSVVMALVILVLLLRPAGLFVRGRTSVVDRV